MVNNIINIYVLIITGGVSRIVMPMVDNLYLYCSSAEEILINDHLRFCSKRHS